ncbi:MAG TPA: hypothetical protein VGG39_01925 [Polyangiaceae bacterium]|jgi:hypothetical protein
MRSMLAVSVGTLVVLGAAAQACSSSSTQQGFTVPDGGGSSGGSSGATSSGGTGSSGGGSSGGTSSSGGLVGDGGTVVTEGGDGSVTVTNTVYANTDDTLYSVNPQTQAVTPIGPMVGTSDSNTDGTVTDVAVDGSGDVYVNTESVIYKAVLPAGGTGTVQLQQVKALTGSTKFYALAFAPVGALDPNNETLVGGDSAGNLWSIDTSSGASKNLGNFGADASQSGHTFELSGDLVFYLDAQGNPTGLATIRSCPSGGSGTSCTGDYLAGVNMTNLKAAYSGTAGASLLGGIYGSSSSGPGAGTGFADVFGLAAWDSTVFGFTRYTKTAAPTLITIDTTSGAGTQVKTFSFPNNDGWSGAGVTTKVTISVPPPPPAQ